MDKIKLEGKFIGYGNGEGLPAWIELSSPELKAQLKPDLSQIKIGDKVWAEGKIVEIANYGQYRLCGQSSWFSDLDIIAHFPSEPEKKEVKLPEKLVFDEMKQMDIEERLISSKLNVLIDVIKEMKENYEKSKS